MTGDAPEDSPGRAAVTPEPAGHNNTTPEPADPSDDITIENAAGGNTAGGDTRSQEDDTTADTPATDPDNGTNDAASPSTLLANEKARSSHLEQRLKMALADYQNLTRRTSSDIESRVTAGMAALLSDLLDIRDDFARARDTFARDGISTDGLDSVLKNVDQTLGKHGAKPIDALGEIFDPHLHEAISTEANTSLDNGTITKEVRRGYMLKNTIIRPSMVVISKKE